MWTTSHIWPIIGRNIRLKTDFSVTFWRNCCSSLCTLKELTQHTHNLFNATNVFKWQNHQLQETEERNSWLSLRPSEVPSKDQLLLFQLQRCRSKTEGNVIPKCNSTSILLWHLHSTKKQQLNSPARQWLVDVHLVLSSLKKTLRTRRVSSGKRQVQETIFTNEHLTFSDHRVKWKVNYLSNIIGIPGVTFKWNFPKSSKVLNYRQTKLQIRNITLINIILLQILI